jgi:hypothetical protein
VSRADGAALLIALMAMMLMLALGTALMLTTITETRIASSYGAGIEMFYAAEAAIERAMEDLRTIPGWSGLSSSATMSAFVDGQPGGARTLADGTTIDLADATNAVRGGDQTADSRSWRLFAYGALTGLLPAGRIESRAYVVVWVAEAPSARDAESLALLAHAYGPQGVLRALEVVVTRADLNGSRGIRVLSWREVP